MSGKKPRYLQSKLVPPPPPPKKSTAVIWSEKLWKVIVGIIIILSGIVYFFQTCDIFKSPHEKFEDQYIAQGDLKPLELPQNTAESDTGKIERIEPKKIEKKIPFDSEKTVNPQKERIQYTEPEIVGIDLKGFIEKNWLLLNIGGNINNLYLGSIKPKKDEMMVFNLLEQQIGNKEIFNLFGGIIDNKLYVSMEIKDLQKEEAIGVIEYSHWKLYKPNLFDFISTDSSLKIIDKQNFVVLSLQYTIINNMPGIKLSGYFMNKDGIVLVDDLGGIATFRKDDPTWKQSASNWMSSKFKYNNVKK